MAKNTESVGNFQSSRQIMLRGEGRKHLRFKKVFRWSKGERLLRLFRIVWERQRLGITYSVKLSFGIARKFEDSWVGVYWNYGPISHEHETFVYVCLIPWFPIRVHYKRSYGGLFV